MTLYKQLFSKALWSLRFLILLPIICFAEDRIVVNEDSLIIDLNPHVRYLEDADRSLTFEQLSRDVNRKHFRPLKDNKVFLTTKTSSRYWVRLTFDKTTHSAPKEWVLYIANLPVSLYDITVWAPNKNREYETFHVGWGVEGKSSTLDTFHYAFPFTLQEGGPEDIYILVDNDANGLAISLPLFAYEKIEFFKYENQMMIFMSTFYAVTLSLLLYNMCVWLITRQKVYFAYINALGSIICLTSLLDGSMMHYFLQDYPLWRAKLAYMVGLYGVGVYIVFVYWSLDVPRYLPKWQKVFKYNAPVLGLMLPAALIFPINNVMAIIAEIYATIGVSLIVIVLIIGIKRRIPTAPYLLLAEICVCVGAATMVLSLQGVIGFNSITLWELHIGYFSEAILLSFAVGIRSNIVYREKLEAQELATNYEKHASANLLKYKSIYNQAVQGLFQAAMDGRIIDANPAMAKIFGYQQVLELLSGNVYIGENLFVDSDDFTTFKLAISRGEAVQDFQFKLRKHASDEEIWVSLSATITVEEHRPVMIEGSIVDINARKEKEAAEYSRHLAEAESRAKGDFLAKMSHEIRTPMTGVVGMSELLRDRLTDKTDRQYNDIIHSSGNALLTIINDILDYSKIEAGKMELASIPFDMERTAFDALNVFKLKAHDKGIELVLDVQTDMARFYQGDPVRIRQIMLNFVSNAVKFTQHGAVVLRVEYDDEDLMKISVTDTGLGISEENVKSLFQSFTQVNGNHEFGGTGLGLSISKQLAALMGGEVGVSSEEGVGSTFWASLKLSRVEPVKLLFDPDEVAFARGKSIGIMHPSRYVIQNIKALARGCGIETIVFEKEDSLQRSELDILIVAEDWVKGKGWLVEGGTAAPADFSRYVVISSGIDASISSLQDKFFTLETPVLTSHFLSLMAHYFSTDPINRSGDTGPRGIRVAGERLRVLLAEDNSVNQLVISKIVAKIGHDVDVVNDGKEAFERVKERHEDYDIILMDCEMPVMDGFEATRSIRDWEASQGVKACPIFALTAHILQAQVDLCHSAGMDGHLIKPLEVDKLIDVLLSIKC